MTSKIKVAIASCHDKANFGSALQAYATQQSIFSLGVDVLTIDKRGLGKEISRGRNGYYLKNLLNLELYRAKLGFLGHRVKQKTDKSFAEKMNERKSAFSRFESSRFRFTGRAQSFDELSETMADFDFVVVGSDQLWLPVNIEGNYYTLSFVPSPVRKISYATSFGVSSLSKSYLDRVGHFLSDFAAISVREHTGAELVRKATGRSCQVVCDPTMLLTRKEWDELASTEFVPDEPYVVCYFMGKNIWNRECAVEYARKRGLKIVAIAHPDEYVAYDDGYADYYPWEAGPADWVGLIAHADAVFTDSFHGTVFSNIFSVSFFSFRRHENAGRQSTNSRIDTLLDVLGAGERIVESKEDFWSIKDSEIDFESVSLALESYRNQSLEFLTTALGGVIKRD